MHGENFFQLLDWHKFDWNKPLEWRLAQLIPSENIAASWRMKTSTLSPVVEKRVFQTSSSLIFSTPRNTYIKQNIFCPLSILYSKVDLCSNVCWSWHTLPDKRHKRHSIFLFYPRLAENSVSAESHSVVGCSRVLQSKLCDFDKPYFQKMIRKHQKVDLCERPLPLVPKKFRSTFPQTNIFCFSFSLRIVHFLQSVLRRCDYRLCRFPVLMAGIRNAWYFATESALYRVLHECLVRKKEQGDLFQITVESKTVSASSRWQWVLRKSKLY